MGRSYARSPGQPYGLRWEPREPTRDERSTRDEKRPGTPSLSKTLPLIWQTLAARVHPEVRHSRAHSRQREGVFGNRSHDGSLGRDFTILNGGKVSASAAARRQHMWPSPGGVITRERPAPWSSDPDPSFSPPSSASRLRPLYSGSSRGRGRLQDGLPLFHRLRNPRRSRSNPHPSKRQRPTRIETPQQQGSRTCPARHRTRVPLLPHGRRIRFR